MVVVVVDTHDWDLLRCCLKFFRRVVGFGVSSPLVQLSERVLLIEG